MGREARRREEAMARAVEMGRRAPVVTALVAQLVREAKEAAARGVVTWPVTTAQPLPVWWR